MLIGAALSACGGGGSSGGQSSNGQYYVDASGSCGGRKPCFTTLAAAASASFKSQFELDASNKVVGAKRPGDPPDLIAVMPGTYRSARAGDWVLFLGMNGEEFPPASWKVRIVAEQGPARTTISGNHDGPCIWITDYIDLELSGFTITGCTRVSQDMVNDQYSVFIQTFSHANIRLTGNRVVDNPTTTGIGLLPYYAGLVSVNVEISRNQFSGNLTGIFCEGFPIVGRPDYDGHILIANNLFYGNSAAGDPSYGRGISLGPATITSEAGVRVDVVHNTVVDNAGVGLLMPSFDVGVNVQNNIVYGNQMDIVGGRATSTVTRNLVGEALYLSGDGNIIGDPLFVDRPNRVFGLSPNSPAVDAGATLGITEAGFDYNGDPRPQDGDHDGVARPDMGAIELK